MYRYVDKKKEKKRKNNNNNYIKKKFKKKYSCQYCTYIITKKISGYRVNIYREHC